jgi:hypothetical protein
MPTSERWADWFLDRVSKDHHEVHDRSNPMINLLIACLLASLPLKTLHLCALAQQQSKSTAKILCEKPP